MGFEVCVSHVIYMTLRNIFILSAFVVDTVVLHSEPPLWNHCTYAPAAALKELPPTRLCLLPEDGGLWPITG